MPGFVVIALCLCVQPLFAAPNDQAPPLPAPTGTVVYVSTEAQLQSAVAGAANNSTIMIAPGTYSLSATLYLNNKSGVTLRGATNDRDDVVLVGKGMRSATDGNVPFGVWTNGAGITIANLTIRDVYTHPIIFNTGTSSPHVYNVRLVDAGEQFIKSTSGGGAGGANNGLVEYSVMEYTTTARNDYTNGIDVHSASGWIIRNNLFRNITAPAGALAGPAVLMWNKSSGALVEGNTFINCQREISMGLIERSPDDNTGGIVRNNFIYRKPGFSSDVAIFVADSPNTQVLHNTILVNGNYSSAIEYRFANTTGVVIRNNLLDSQIRAREGATAIVTDNYTTAVPSMFVNPAAGDMHLVAGATPVINRVTLLSNAPSDWDGDARPASGAVDFGADEYGGSVTPPPPPPPTNQAPVVAITSPVAGAPFTAPAAIGVSANATDADGTVTRVDFYAGSTLIGFDTSSPFSITWNNVAAGTYFVTAVARDNANATKTSAAVAVTVSPATGGVGTAGTVPAPWKSIDIGSPALAGSASYASSTFTVNGAGADIWDTSDQFQFVYQPLTGNGQVIARVASLTKPDGWTKAGVMIRSALAANAAHAFALVSASQGSAFQRRATAGSTSTHSFGSMIAAPAWVKLVRSGNTFSAFSSLNGTTWVQIGSSQSITMGATVYVGLAVTSHNTGVLATSTLTNVQVTPTP
jgi:hypothetical protein